MGDDIRCSQCGEPGGILVDREQRAQLDEQVQEAGQAAVEGVTAPLIALLDALLTRRLINRHFSGLAFCPLCRQEKLDAPRGFAWPLGLTIFGVVLGATVVAAPLAWLIFWFAGRRLRQRITAFAGNPVASDLTVIFRCYRAFVVLLALHFLLLAIGILVLFAIYGRP